MSLQLVQETAIERGETDEMIFTREEFAQFDQHFKRRLAGAANTDEISGRSTLLEIKSYLVCQYTLDEFVDSDE
ncbi:hypothetical protein HFTV1-gp25 [Haloferax tailed virus 1]|uniref:Uncharacterized protein n=1 Tax=Haloferax tailed virus 1 TaxID=2507575 RepID=A0A410N6S9_HFTV1|nr:hypothetical protein M1M17_gp25 [Haloferax tailed virus 1]QAS68858.1 hypothetical protein HFTV1-gp25 [Haloferax tailed virus 1]